MPHAFIANPLLLLILAAIVFVALIVLAIWYATRRERTKKLKQHFGSEYDRTVVALGSRSKAEAELRARERRVASLNIVPLVPAEAARLTQAWTLLQSRFVDNPKGVVIEADQLVRELMAKRGFPMCDFERRTADISVKYPEVVDHYRAAQAIAERDRRGEADTEELRKAVVHYRALFDELLESSPVRQVSLAS